MENILRKTWLIGIVVLFVGASVLPGINANINEAGEITLKQTQPQPQPLTIFWEENFDLYTPGDGMHGIGGWEGWHGDPAWDAYVTDVQSHTPDNSVDIVGDADLVHTFSGVDSGVWNFTCYVYTPSDFTGQSYFILLNTYGATDNWSTQLKFDSDEGIIYSEFEGEQIFLTYDEWVELRVQIDFDTDTQYIYYDGVLLSEKSWTEGVSGGGALNLGAVDLFANSATTMYYDSFTLEGPEVIEPDLTCSGDLDWIDVETGATVTGTITVENIGAGELNWEIQSYPTDWGDWTFSDMSGTGVVPGTPVTIDVTVVAPDEQETNFTGEVVLVNSDDPDDICIIDVSLATPVNQEPTGLFGWVFLRGLVFNPRDDGSTINARALNLHYLEITPTGVHKGVVRLKKVSFRNGIFIKMSEKGLLGKTVHVSGFCHGGIEIQ